MRPLRRLLDALYLAGGIAGACFTVAILLIIVAQMVARWSGQVFPGATAYAGYCMAAASFFALAHALDRGAHIRVSLLLSRLGRFRRAGEVWCYGVGLATAVYFSHYAIKATWWSHKLKDVSQGQDATPLWIPQIAMCAGTVLLAVALADHLLRIVFCGHPGVPASGDGAAKE